MSKQKEIKTRRKKDKESLQERIKALEVEAAKEIVDQMFVIMDGIEGAIYVADMETYELLHVNSYIRKHFGNDLVGKKCYKMLHNQQDRPCAFCTNKQLITNGKPVPPLVRDYFNSRTGLWYQYSDRAIRWPDGRLVHMQVAIDITERKKAEIVSRRSERFLNTIFDSINDPFNIIDTDYRIIKANEPYAQLRGKTLAQLMGKRCFEILQNRQSPCEGCSVKVTFDTGEPHTKEKRGGDSHIWLEIYTYPIFDEMGRVVSVIEYTRDITQRKQAEEERDMLVKKLVHLSRTDDLTGLLNRRALIERLGDEIRRSRRYRSDLALIICDIDYFKEINDTYGHDAGDKVLQIISSLMKDLLRQTDVIGRYGGDEFLLILPETALKGAREIAERIHEAVREYEIKIGLDSPIKTTVSLGVAQFDSEKEDVNDLVKRADNALYIAKGKGRDRVYLIKD
jgi:diguanylate cyclase (GGDEF)-like protein/PAS domain S-box-containing protein